jgi:hypothetical protein
MVGLTVLCSKQGAKQLGRCPEHLQDGVRQGRVEQPADRQAGRAAQSFRHALNHPAYGRRDVHRQLVRIQPVQRPGQFGHGAPVNRHGAMSGAPAESGLDPADLFLSHHDGIETLPADGIVEAAEFAESVAHILK